MKNVEKVFSLLEDALGKYDNKTHRGCLKTCVEVEGRVMDLLIYECYDGGLAVLEDNSLVKYIREETIYTPVVVDSNKTVAENYASIITECYEILDDYVRRLEDSIEIMK